MTHMRRRLGHTDAQTHGHDMVMIDEDWMRYGTRKRAGLFSLLWLSAPGFFLDMGRSLARVNGPLFLRCGTGNGACQK